ncbi:MATE family efflux transporter [Leucobacter sp. USCH14]|uniref:MATE family efflux transporter n=1 Tax=Leucobacter sp. USCH14 TaxID=3024838 RepID=UPI0030AB58A6
MTPDRTRAERRSIDRSIAHLAIPALGALIAEPMFLIVDSALVGHLGAVPLAGLAIASAVLQTTVGLMIFLAYATTPLVARTRGAGDLRGAVQYGIDGLWLALGIGVAVGAALWLASGPIVASFGADEPATRQALAYLTVSCLGIPAMLVVFAASGLLRGLQDTRTPLAVATVGFALNALLNWWFIYGLGFGIAGSAWGTVLAQWAMVAVYLIVVVRHARRAGARLLPRRAGLGRASQSGGWLFVRTLGLRAALLATVFAATSHGTAATAAYQVVFTIFSTAAFALDALAIAAQALIGDALGSGDPHRARMVVRRSVFWGIGCGLVFGGALALASPAVGRMFTDDDAVLTILPAAILVLGISLPLAGYVFVLDGVLMGAGDARYLAWTSLINLTAYLPVLWALTVLVPAGTSGLIALTAGFTVVFMTARAVTLGIRARGDRWVRLGV